MNAKQFLILTFLCLCSSIVLSQKTTPPQTTVQYDTIIYTRSDYLIAKKDEKFGVLDTQKQILVPFIYENIDHYSPQSSLVKLHGLWLILKADGLHYPPKSPIFKHPEQVALFLPCEVGQDYSDCKKISETALLQFVENELIYPEIAKQHSIEGIVVIALQISDKGQIVNPKIVRDIGAGCGIAALKVVEKLGEFPWQSAMQDGIAVWMNFYLPVHFSL